MNNSMLFAAIVGIVNTIALNVCPFIIDEKESGQLIINITQALSPFVALFALRWYVKMDHPPALIRAEAALDAAIKACRKDLHDKDATDEFKKQVRANLDDFLLQKQKLRIEFNRSTPYTSSLPNSINQTDT